MKRHALSTRLWHWLNLVCVVVLFMSGLTISNAHRYLYWGDWGFDARDAWLAVPRFPDWMTIPGYYSLAVARDWHIGMAWPFAVGLLVPVACHAAKSPFCPRHRHPARRVASVGHPCRREGPFAA
jgi:thiosulfate reductase cytochrome b subunit